MMKFDKLTTGLLVGIAGPFIAVFLYYIIKYSDFGFLNFIQHLTKLNLLSPVLSLSLVANLATFFLFIFLKWDNASKGVLMSTFIYGSVIVYLIYIR